MGLLEPFGNISKKSGNYFFDMANSILQIILAVFFFYLLLVCETVTAANIRLKEIARFEGVRDNILTGYGLVTGLAGTGDSPRSQTANQSLINSLSRFGVNVVDEDVRSRNVAAVIVTATLKPFAEPGDHIDVGVSSIGDARSLNGGTLLLTPLKAVNNKIYALSQGQLSVGGFAFDLNGNTVQKNHPTVAIIPGGGLIEKGSNPDYVDADRMVHVILNNPDFTTVQRLENALNLEMGSNVAKAINAGKIAIKIPENMDIIEAISRLESVSIYPDRTARVVINERTGILVAGGDVRIDDVTISHGSLRLVISTDYQVSQPLLARNTGDNIRSLVVPDTDVQVTEPNLKSVNLNSGATIADLVAALRQIKTTTRELITILQAINSAGALHAELIIQ